MRLTQPGQVSFGSGQQLLDASMPAYDNFYIRVLCGPDVYLLPAGAIQREHLEWAKARRDRSNFLSLSPSPSLSLSRTPAPSLAPTLALALTLALAPTLTLNVHSYQARLDQFSVVMTHESIARHARQLTSRLGWPKLAMNCAQQENPTPPPTPTPNPNPTPNPHL